MEAGRTHCRNHGRLGVATQALLQQPVEKGREGEEGGDGGEEEAVDGRGGEGRGGGGGGMGYDRISKETKGDQCLTQRG